eukprot:760319-Hanusia_phi.AAC.4
MAGEVELQPTYPLENPGSVSPQQSEGSLYRPHPILVPTPNLPTDYPTTSLAANTTYPLALWVKPRGGEDRVEGV